MSTKLDYSIFPDKELILERLSGPTSYQDLVSLTERVWNDSRYDRSYNAVVDIRHASLDLRHSSVESFTRLVLASESASGGKIAVLSSKPVETALSYFLAKKLAGGTAMSVFSTWGGVAAYLGLSEPVLAEITGEWADDVNSGISLR